MMRANLTAISLQRSVVSDQFTAISKWNQELGIRDYELI